MNAACTRPTLPSWFVDQVLALPREAVAELDAVGVGRLVAIRAAALGGMSPTRIPQGSYRSVTLTTCGLAPVRQVSAAPVDE